jgi:archaeal flagellar protein FlaJ
MKITQKQIKHIAIYSTCAAIAFFIISAIFFLTSPTLDYMIVIALTIAVGPASIASIIHSRWRAKIERATPEFLRDLATAAKTGIPLQASLEHASKRSYGPLTDELKILVAHMSWGMNFNEAMNEFATSINLPTITRATTLIIEAGRHGGDLSNIFDSTAQYVENVNLWANKRKMQTFPYIAVFYFSVFIFLFIIILISTMLFGQMAQAPSGSASLIKPVLTAEESRRVFLHAALLESVFGGLIAGKINEDSFADGLKHVAVLCVACGIAFYLFSG